ncbi:MAG: hypothetical protein WB297_06360, partial [Actinomycetota bacterium]
MAHPSRNDPTGPTDPSAPSDPQPHHDLLGGASAATSAILFGTIIIWGRQVLERGVPVETMLSIRFAIGAFVLFVALLV